MSCSRPGSGARATGPAASTSRPPAATASCEAREQDADDHEHMFASTPADAQPWPRDRSPSDEI